jgi:catechol 2,3-dioxygenase-like lactoylglutathione lyase family enzyme
MRRCVLGIVAALALETATVSVRADGAVAPGHDSARVDAVGAIGMTVADVQRSAAFYADVLGFETVADTEVTGEHWGRRYGVPDSRRRIVQMRLGDERIELMQFLRSPGRPIPPDSRSHDRWFQHIAIIVSDMDRAYARLRAAGVVQVSPTPQRLPDWNPAAGGIRAFYFKDPDGHVLEVLWFPPGKGAAKWRRSDTLFLGIDHTAIVVADTARSLACYRDALGLAVVGTSENWGPEQERLNNVPDARLRITTLRAPEGPGIEFLEYVTPRDGRPVPADARANDLAHWQTGVLTPDAAGLERALRGGACAVPPPAAMIALPGRDLGFGRGFVARDPDGHVMQVLER